MEVHRNKRLEGPRGVQVMGRGQQQNAKTGCVCHRSRAQHLARHRLPPAFPQPRLSCGAARSLMPCNVRNRPQRSPCRITLGRASMIGCAIRA